MSEGNLLRQVFEATVERCVREVLVAGEGFAVDASLIFPDPCKVRSFAAENWSPEGPRACQKALDDAAFGAASPSQPPSRTLRRNGPVPRNFAPNLPMSQTT